MSLPFSTDSIPELDRLIDEKFSAIAVCLAGERNMGNFDDLSEDAQDALLNDTLDMVEVWKSVHEKDRPCGENALQRLLQEYHELTLHMQALHREVDRMGHSSN